MKLKKHITEGYFSGTETEDELTQIEETGREISSYGIVLFIRFDMLNHQTDHTFESKLSDILRNNLEQLRFITEVSNISINHQENIYKHSVLWNFGVDVTSKTPKTILLTFASAFQTIKAYPEYRYANVNSACMDINGNRLRMEEDAVPLFSELSAFKDKLEIQGSLKVNRYKMTGKKMNQFESLVRDIMEVTGHTSTQVFNTLENILYGATPHFAMMSYFLSNARLITDERLIAALNTLDPEFIDYRKYKMNNHRFAQIITDGITGVGYTMERSTGCWHNPDVWAEFCTKKPRKWFYSYSIRCRNLKISAELGSVYCEENKSTYTGILVIIIDPEQDVIDAEFKKNFDVDTESEEYAIIRKFVDEQLKNARKK